MSEEVSADEQAAAYIKLQDNVRSLIRTEILLALNDPNFVNEVRDSYPFMNSLALDICNSPDFKSEFRNRMTQMVNNI